MIKQGAEARVTLTQNSAKKERIPKSYRHAVLDEKLRFSRTKREAKVLRKLAEQGIPVPALQETEEALLVMERISGKQLKDVFAEHPVTYARSLAKIIADMHQLGIIHGDLTSSNVIMHPQKGLHLIDFGLSFFSSKEEDKAVDLHLCFQAVAAHHPEHYAKIRKVFLETYQKQQGMAVLKRLAIVEKRGRHQQKH